MAKGIGETHKQVVKKTSQGGHVKTSTLNKVEKRSFKKYRGQGK
jgi:hypothetical protein